MGNMERKSTDHRSNSQLVSFKQAEKPFFMIFLTVLMYLTGSILALLGVYGVWVAVTQFYTLSGLDIQQFFDWFLHLSTYMRSIVGGGFAILLLSVLFSIGFRLIPLHSPPNNQ